MRFEKDGQIGGQVDSIIGLIVGVGVASLVLIFVGTLGGQTYNLVEGKICDLNAAEGCPDGIADGNIQNNVHNAITAGFDAIQVSGEYLPLIVLAIVIFMVLGLVMGMGRSQQGYSGAL